MYRYLNHKTIASSKSDFLNHKIISSCSRTNLPSPKFAEITPADILHFFTKYETNTNIEIQLMQFYNNSSSIVFRLTSKRPDSTSSNEESDDMIESSSMIESPSSWSKTTKRSNSLGSEEGSTDSESLDGVQSKKYELYDLVIFSHKGNCYIRNIPTNHLDSLKSNIFILKTDYVELVKLFQNLFDAHKSHALKRNDLQNKHLPPDTPTRKYALPLDQERIIANILLYLKPKDNKNFLRDLESVLYDWNNLRERLADFDTNDKGEPNHRVSDFLYNWLVQQSNKTDINRENLIQNLKNMLRLVNYFLENFSENESLKPLLVNVVDQLKKFPTNYQDVFLKILQGGISENLNLSFIDDFTKTLEDWNKLRELLSNFDKDKDGQPKHRLSNYLFNWYQTEIKSASDYKKYHMGLSRYIRSANYFLDKYMNQQSQSPRKLSQDEQCIRPLLIDSGILPPNDNESEYKNLELTVGAVFKSYKKMIQNSEECKDASKSHNLDIIPLQKFNEYRTKLQTLIDANNSLNENSLWPGRLDFEPRNLKIMLWISEGVRQVFKPMQLDGMNEEDEGFVKNCYNELYNIMTALAFFNFTIDDFADDFRDPNIVKLIMEIFPSKAKDQETFKQNKFNPDEILDTEDTVKAFITQYINSQKFDQSLSIFKSQEQKDKLLTPLTECLVHSFSIYKEEFEKFESLILKIEERFKPNTSLPVDKTKISSPMPLIIYNYGEILKNFDSAVTANTSPSFRNINDASYKVHHNMNMIAFHQMMAWVNLAIKGKNTNEIKNVLDMSLFKDMFQLEQKMGRIGNILATATPKDGNMGRELESGDLSGQYEVITKIYNSQTSYRNEWFVKFESIFDKLADVDRENHKERMDCIIQLSDFLIQAKSESIATNFYLDYRNDIEKRWTQLASTMPSNDSGTLSPPPPAASPTKSSSTVKKAAKNLKEIFPGQDVNDVLVNFASLFWHHLMHRGTI